MKSCISRISWGTKNTKVKTTSPRSAWRKTSRMIYRSRMRMTRTVSVARTRQRSPWRAPRQFFGRPANAPCKLPNLAVRGARTLQVSPALRDLPVGDSPNYDSIKFQPLLRCRIGPRPMVAHHYFVVFGDQVFDAHAHVGNFF